MLALLLMAMTLATADVSQVYPVVEVYAYFDYKQAVACTGCPHCDVCTVSNVTKVAYAKWIVDESSKHGIDPLIPAVQVWLESKLLASVVRKGGTDTGLMQIVPGYVKKLGYSKQSLLAPRTNLECGIKALGFWKKSKKYGANWLDHNAYGIYLPINAHRQAKIMKQVAWWRTKMEKTPWHRLAQWLRQLGDGLQVAIL